METKALLEALRAGELPPSPALAGALTDFARGLASGAVSDAQAGAFAMAVCLRGLGAEGRVALTLAMRDSGERLRWDLAGPVLDKHSTGGLGDCTSLLLAPALAACGAFVPMVSGRGLGHTGGTLDKLEAIPGYRVDLAPERLRQVVAEVGCAIVGASGRLAPADRRLYAVRDVTGTVASVDLITASILAKKLAVGLGGLVLDVKLGSGAFLPGPEAARELAQALVTTAQGAGCPACALLTDMNQPLARSAGNALEVAEVMAVLTGSGASPALVEVSVALGGELLALGGLAADAARGRGRIAQVLADGRAAERFEAMVAAQGGPPDFLARWRQHLPQAPVVREVAAPQAGRLRALDTRALGQAVVALGGGRRREGDRIDPAVGFSRLRRLGEAVGPGEPLALVHAADPAAAEAAARTLQAACRIGTEPALPPLIYGRIG